MRGLDIRQKWARGLALATIIGDEDGDERSESRQEAEALGRHDYQNGRDRSDAPALFRDEGALHQAWLCGWDDSDEAEDIRHCSTCQSESTVICPAHG